MFPICLLFARWVHLLCALYTPDVAFVKPEKLQCVTLSEVPPYKWGAKVCPSPQELHPLLIYTVA